MPKITLTELLVAEDYTPLRLSDTFSYYSVTDGFLEHTVTATDVARLARYHAREDKRRAFWTEKLRADHIAAQRHERAVRAERDAERLADTRQAFTKILAARSA